MADEGVQFIWPVERDRDHAFSFGDEDVFVHDDFGLRSLALGLWPLKPLVKIQRPKAKTKDQRPLLDHV